MCNCLISDTYTNQAQIVVNVALNMTTQQESSLNSTMYNNGLRDMDAYIHWPSLVIF